MKNKITETIKKELRQITRDKKSLLMMLVTPLMIPLFIFLFSFLYNEIMYSEEIDIYKIGTNYTLNEIEEEIIKASNLELVHYGTQEELQNEFTNGNIDAYVIQDGTDYTIYSNEKSEQSSMAGYSISTYLDSYNNYLGQNYLLSIEANLENVYNNIRYTHQEITGSNDLVDTIINFGFIFAIMSITLTAVYGATDSTAGEKERGTLETFLTFPIKSNELITGKYLAITISCIITAIISTILAIISLLICQSLFEIYNNTILNLNFGTITLILVIMLSYSLFISGLCIAIASFSKTYKEAQSSLTPLSLCVMIPMFLDLLEIAMNKIIALIPIVNHTLLINNIVSGTIDHINIILMFASTIIYVILITIFITKQYKSEKILFST